MKEVQAYRCEHCGKVYLMKTACLEHEAHRCPRNPENRPLCYDCKHYQPSIEADDRERIKYYMDAPWGDLEYSKKFDPNKCKRTDCKLFNNIKLSDEMTDALNEAGYKPMPLPKDGCKDFEQTDGENYKTDKFIFR